MQFHAMVKMQKIYSSLLILKINKKDFMSILVHIILYVFLIPINCIKKDGVVSISTLFQAAWRNSIENVH